jgi:hypothetical protein
MPTGPGANFIKKIIYLTYRWYTKQLSGSIKSSMGNDAGLLISACFVLKFYRLAGRKMKAVN